MLAWRWAAAVLVVPPRTHPRCRAPMAVPRKPERANRSSAASELQTRRSTGAMWCSATQWGQWGQWEACIRQGFPRMAQGCRGVVVGGEAKEIRRSHTPVGPAHRPPEEFAPGHSAQKGHPSTGEAATQAVGQLLRQCLDSATGARAGPAQVLDHDLEPNCGKQRKGKRKITRKTRCCCRWQVKGNERSRHCDFFSSLE